MEKQIRRFEVNYQLSWEYDNTIDSIRKDLDEMEKLGVTHVNIEADVCYDSATILFTPLCERMENDADFALRMAEQSKKQSELEKWELAQFEKLKLKYNK